MLLSPPYESRISRPAAAAASPLSPLWPIVFQFSNYELFESSRFVTLTDPALLRGADAYMFDRWFLWLIDLLELRSARLKNSRPVGFEVFGG